MEAYELAIEYLCAGAMPFIFDAEDGLHVLSLIPQDRDTLIGMINPDVGARLRFMCELAIACKTRVAAQT
jgi:hypothetical protein